MAWSIGSCGAPSASGKRYNILFAFPQICHSFFLFRLALDSARDNSEIMNSWSSPRDEAAGLSDISNNYRSLDSSNTSELCTGERCGEYLQWRFAYSWLSSKRKSNCLNSGNPREPLSNYPRLRCLHKILKDSTIKKSGSSEGGSKPLLKEKTVINLSMFCSFHPAAECLHNQKSHWPYLSDEISYYSYLSKSGGQIQSKTVSSYLLGDIGIISLQYVILRHPAPPTLIILLSMSFLLFTTLNLMWTPSHSKSRPFCQVDRFLTKSFSPKSQLTSTLPFYCW